MSRSSLGDNVKTSDRLFIYVRFSARVLRLSLWLSLPPGSDSVSAVILRILEGRSVCPPWFSSLCVPVHFMIYGILS